LSAEEFLRRFLLHVLPRGLVKIRHYGLLANRRREGNLKSCRRLLLVQVVALALVEPVAAALAAPLCPWCGRGRLVRIRRLPRLGFSASQRQPINSS
jgi:hypothetical protein